MDLVGFCTRAAAIAPVSHSALIFLRPKRQRATATFYAVARWAGNEKTIRTRMVGDAQQEQYISTFKPRPYAKRQAEAQRET